MVYRRTGGQTVLYLICSTILGEDFARNRVSQAKNLGTWEMCYNFICINLILYEPQQE